jgi:pimeloyl-ACP methyl ester carboxylesterase
MNMKKKEIEKKMDNKLKTLGLLLFLMVGQLTFGQSIYTKTFGNTKDKPIIFLHGGPGYNCVNFETTTAQQLADKGFYVIVYDRRGEGRSEDLNAQFTFQETFDDLNAIYQKYGLTKSTLIGHSFGGVIATLFAEKYASQSTYQAPQGFWKNEKYTTIDLTANLKNLQAGKIKIYGLYGKDDGLYSADQVQELKNRLGTDHVKYFDNCSHYVFIDQQSQFIDAIEAWTK